MIYRWVTVYDSGPTLNQNLINVSYLVLHSMHAGRHNGFIHYAINPLTAGPDYIRFFIFVLAHQVPPFKHVKDKTSHQTARLEK